MDDISKKLWMAAAGVLLLSLIVGGLIFGFASTTPATERQTAAQAAFPKQEVSRADVTEPNVQGNVDHTDGTLPADTTHPEEASPTEPGTPEPSPSAPATADPDVTEPSSGEDGDSATPTSDASATGTTVAGAAAAPIPEAFDVETGEELYVAACQSCHQPGGVGADNGAAVYPALAGNQNLKAPAYPMAFILNGAGAMPSFASTLNDEQVAKVVNYLRTDLNDFDGEVSAEDVAPNRPDKQTSLGSDAG